MLKPSLLAALAMLALVPRAHAQREPMPSIDLGGERVISLLLEGGQRQRVLYDSPARPRATLVMLPGGTGNVGVRRDGGLRHEDNFVGRTRAAWVAMGYAVLIPDTIDGSNLRGARSSSYYGRVVDELAAYAHSRAAGPVFLIGTSQGTIAAMNGAAHARQGLVAGLILTESVSRPGRLSTETVFDADPQDVRVPALVIANRNDACDVAPPATAPRIIAAMKGSPSARLFTVSGGVQRSERACGSLSPHGYYGIEGQVIDAAVAWIRIHGG
jgi:pimeloyl-ACP methyl ester carboxylesterase